MDRRYRIYITLSICAGCLGCADGPFYALKRVNPYFQSEWKKDRAYGPTFSDRLKELDLLESQLADMPQDEQAEWARRLDKIVQKDPSPELRARAVAAIARVPGDTATTALNVASGDDVEKVRLAACKAWKLRGDEPARDMLLSLAQADESTSVRQAAIESLSAYDDQEVRQGLVQLLDDRSPAVQHQVAQSLKEISGRDYGGDFDAWKKFIAGEEVPEPGPVSIAEKMWNALPKWQ
jgi:hypothetical protein